MTPITGAVEGVTDAAVLRELVHHCGGELGPVHGQRGKSHLEGKLAGYNAAALHGPWVVLIDLDLSSACAPEYISSLAFKEATRMRCCVVVRALEAWLLADRHRLAAYLGVALTHVPTDPELLDDPKAAMVAVAARSRRRDVREDMVPTPVGGRRIGPGYTGRLVSFIRSHDGWRIDEAAAAAPSLARAVRRIQELVHACP